MVKIFKIKKAFGNVLIECEECFLEHFCLFVCAIGSGLVRQIMFCFDILINDHVWCVLFLSREMVDPCS